MRKAQRTWVQVSKLAGRITFDVSGGKEGDPAYIPLTKGFTVEVSYANDGDLLYNALCNTAVDVQNILRVFYRKNGRFPFQPGKVQKVDGDGQFTLPATVHLDRLEGQAKAGELDAEAIRRLRLLLANAEAAIASAANDAPISDDWTPEHKYEMEWLNEQSLTRLRVTAAVEGIEHDGVNREDLIEALASVES